jgi:hypothetical protein
MTKKNIILFAILSLLNILIFFNREIFAYIPVSSYSSLYENQSQKEREKWKRFTNDYPIDEIKEAQKISSTWFNKYDKTTLDSVVKIAEHIYKCFYNQTGKPTNYLEQLSPVNKYKALLKDSTERLWCGTYSQIFNFFCLSNNILSRYIEIINPRDHHVVNESYIPNLNKWLLVDLTYNITAPKNNLNQFLNLHEFATALRRNEIVLNYPYIQSDTVTKNHIAATTYYIPDRPYFYHFYIDNNEAYKFENKLIRYILPVSWYVLYTSSPVSNYMFGIKVVLFFMWLTSGLFLLYIILNNDRNKRFK